MIRRHLFAALAVALAAAAPARAQPAKPDFAVGQVWSVKASPPTTAKVIIDRIEDFGGHTAVHVSVIDVPVPPGLAISRPTMAIGHLPFDAAALAASLDQVVGSQAPPDAFEGGYQQWKAAKGGVFTISVPAALEVVFKAVPKAQPAG